MSAPAARVAVVVVALAALAGCGSGSGGSGGSGRSSSSRSGPSGTIVVLAAASLTEAFTTLGRQFEAAHPGTRVVFSFGPSSGLATQVIQGAPADVFASASPQSMDQVISAGAGSAATVFAKNTMEIAVPPADPAHIAGLADLARPGVKVALCQAQVPCGSVARTIFHNAHLPVTPVTLEADVKSVLAKVTLGEVDAGLVYVTDVRAAGAKVKGIEIASDVNASTSYPIAALSHAPNRAGATAFVDFVRSAAGAAVLTRDGFQAP